MERFESRIEEIEDLSPLVRRLRLVRVDGQAFAFRPGQHVTLYLTTADGRTVGGAYSLCDPPRADGVFAVCVKRTGTYGCADELLARHVGDAVLTEGPMGRFVLDEPVQRDLVLVATGAGIAPFHAMLKQLERAAAQRKVWLLLGARHAEDLLFDGDWRAIAASRGNFHYWPMISRTRPGDGWGGATGYVTELVQHVPGMGREPRLVYLCGRPEMLQSVRERLLRLGLGADLVRTDG